MPKMKRSSLTGECVAARGPSRSFSVHSRRQPSIAAAAKAGAARPTRAEAAPPTVSGVPCAARYAGQVGKLGPEYRTSNMPTWAASGPTPLRCAARRWLLHALAGLAAPAFAGSTVACDRNATDCREAHRLSFLRARAPCWLQRRVRAGCGAPVRRRGAQGSWPRAQRASLTDSSPLSECSERSERSEFGDGPRDRAPQGSRRAAPTASPKRRSLPARAFARAERRTQCSRTPAATGRKQTPQTTAAFQVSRVARSAVESN